MNNLGVAIGFGSLVLLAGGFGLGLWFERSKRGVKFGRGHGKPSKREFVGAQHAVEEAVPPFQKGGKITTVLVRCTCGCGEVGSWTLAGHWTLADITGQHPASAVVENLIRDTREGA